MVKRLPRPAKNAERVPSSATTKAIADASWLLVSRLMVALMGWCGTLLIVRQLSGDAWGKYTFVFATLGMLLIITNAVGPRVAIRGLLDGSNPGKFVGSYVVLRAFLGLAGYSAVMAFVYLAGYPPVVERAMAVGGLVVVVSSVSVGYGIVFQVNQKMRWIAAGLAFGQSVQLLLTIVLATLGASVVQFTVPAVINEVVILFWTLFFVRRYLKVTYRIVVRTWGALLRGALPVALGQGLFQLYAGADAILLSKMKDFTAVGQYAVAYKFANLLDVVPNALTLSVMALLVRSWPEDMPTFRHAFERSVLIMFVLACLISSQFAIFAKPIITLLYGARYGTASEAARLVVVGACVAFFTALMTTVLTSQGRNRLYVAAGAGGLVVNVVANLLLIPVWSYNGAALVTVLTELLVFGFLVRVSARGTAKQAFLTANIYRTLAITGVAAGVAIGMRYVSPWPVAAGAGSAVFLGLVHYLRVPGPLGLRSLLRDSPT